MPQNPEYEETLKELAHLLATLRQRADMSGHALANALGVTQASVSRIETARQRPRSETVMRWGEITGATDKELDEIASLFEDLTSDYISFRQEHRRGASASQSKTLAEELAYDHIRVMQTALVPGLLQTPAYARCIFELRPRHHTPEEISKSVELRAQRQEQLYDESRRFDFLIFEQALWATYGQRKVMLAQFDHLAQLADLKNVSIGVVPLGRRLPAVPIVSYQVFGGEFVTVETSTGFLTVEDPEEVATYISLFDQWNSLAITGKRTAGWLEEFKGTYTS